MFHRDILFLLRTTLLNPLQPTQARFNIIPTSRARFLSWSLNHNFETKIFHELPIFPYVPYSLPVSHCLVQQDSDALRRVNVKGIMWQTGNSR